MDERTRILRSGKIGYAHFLTLILSFVLTLAAWKFAELQVEARSKANFGRAVDQFSGSLTDRMKNYENSLWAGVALLNANGGQVRHVVWREFVKDLQVLDKYPGVNGIGVIFKVDDADRLAFVAAQLADRPAFTLHPDVPSGEHMVITHIEPEAANLKAVGLDVNFEANRRLALERARDTGTAQITGPIILVQDEKKTPGFLLFAPFYRQIRGDPAAKTAENFLGAVYAPFIVHNLLDGVLARPNRQIAVSIRDGDQSIYDENQAQAESADPKPMFTKAIRLDLYGRTWILDIRTDKAFRAANSQPAPAIILGAGLLINLLLLSLFLLLTRANRRAVTFADNLTSELKIEKIRLEMSNAALEHYAYASSHDLKTPLRGLRDVTDYLSEDLSNDFPETFASPKVSESIADLRNLIDRMDRLIKGILEYSLIGNRPVQIRPIDPAALVAEQVRVLNLPAGAIELNGEFPPINFDETGFSQIVSNLLGNAVKHHDARTLLRIRIAGLVKGEDYILSIADNGPGIEPRFREKIFEVFQVLYPEQSGASTGIGLSIVQRVAQSCGGRVEVGETPGGGAKFVVTLPDVVLPHKSQMRAA